MGTATASFVDVADDVWMTFPQCPCCEGTFSPEPPEGAVSCECGAHLRVDRDRGWWRIVEMATIDEQTKAASYRKAVVSGLGAFLAERLGWITG